MGEDRDAMPPAWPNRVRRSPTGRCPRCGGTYRLRSDGRIAIHRAWDVTLLRARGWEHARNCPGSTLPPVRGSVRSPSSDPQP